MGQYQRWLHFREVDQLLHTQLTALEQQLTQVEEQIHTLEPGILFLHTNPVIQALVGRSFAEITTQEVPAVSTPAELTLEEGRVEEASPISTISPALSAWSHLPNFDTQQIAVPTEALSRSDHQSGVASPDADLLPTSISAFTREQYASIEPPEWYQAEPVVSSAEKHAVPIDRQSQRTNRLVERWFQRWERQAEQEGQSHDN